MLLSVTFCFNLHGLGMHICTLDTMNFFRTAYVLFCRLNFCSILQRFAIPLNSLGLKSVQNGGTAHWAYSGKANGRKLLKHVLSPKS